jgi:hypothetical protein
VVHSHPRFEIELPDAWAPSGEARFVHGEAELAVTIGPAPAERSRVFLDGLRV